jgi:hypothetical protein
VKGQREGYRFKYHPELLARAKCAHARARTHTHGHTPSCFCVFKCSLHVGGPGLGLCSQLHSLSLPHPCPFTPAYLNSDALKAKAVLGTSWGREALSWALAGMRSPCRAVRTPVLALATGTVM